MVFGFLEDLKEMVVDAYDTVSNSKAVEDIKYTMKGIGMYADDAIDAFVNSEMGQDANYTVKGIGMYANDELQRFLKTDTGRGLRLMVDDIVDTHDPEKAKQDAKDIVKGVFLWAGVHSDTADDIVKKISNPGRIVDAFKKDPEEALQKIAGVAMRAASDVTVPEIHNAVHKQIPKSYGASMDDSIIFVMYNMGTMDGPFSGHAAMIYKGKVIDAIPDIGDGNDLKNMIIKGKTFDASIGGDRNEDDSHEFLYFDVNDDTKIFAVKPEELGIVTPEDKEELLRQMDSVAKEDKWNLQKNNCLDRCLQTLAGVGSKKLSSAFQAGWIASFFRSKSELPSKLQNGFMKSFLKELSSLNVISDLSKTDMPYIFANSLQQLALDKPNQCIQVTKDVFKDYQGDFYAAKAERRKAEGTVITDNNEKTALADNNESSLKATLGKAQLPQDVQEAGALTAGIAAIQRAVAEASSASIKNAPPLAENNEKPKNIPPVGWIKETNTR